MTATQLLITGDLASDTVISWICHRARLLDLNGWVTRQSDGSVQIAVLGPAPLIDMMEVACLLGSGDAMVDEIIRSDVPVAAMPNGFEEKSANK